MPKYQCSHKCNTQHTTKNQWLSEWCTAIFNRGPHITWSWSHGEPDQYEVTLMMKIGRHEFHILLNSVVCCPKLEACASWNVACHHGIAVEIIISRSNSDLLAEESTWRSTAIHHGADQRLVGAWAATDSTEAGDRDFDIEETRYGDTADIASYRPVSNLSFLSKTIERIVEKQLSDYLVSASILPPLQSAYRSYHSTETALLCVMSDVFAVVDQQRAMLLGLLDLSAAFDGVDHEILLARLEYTFGLSGNVLCWLQSFLSDRTQRIAYCDRTSEVLVLQFGVPQGWVLGTLLFLMYIAEVFSVIVDHGATAHFYADDGQVYISAPASSAADTTARFVACFTAVDAWMMANQLRLNDEKTQLIWLGPWQQLEKLPTGDVQLLSASVRSQFVRNLGVTLDSQLAIADHVMTVCHTGYYQLR